LPGSERLHLRSKTRFSVRRATVGKRPPCGPASRLASAIASENAGSVPGVLR
jgi:hypothetical protein